MSDLTNPDVYFGFLSSFWALFFQDRDVVRGVAHADALSLQQEYQNFIEASANLAVSTIEPFHRELYVPIVLRKSTFSTGPDKLKIGGGEVFGAQPAGTKFREGTVFVYGGLEKRSGLYYVGVPKGLVGAGHVIVNRLMEPSVMMVRDSDFIFEDNIITFKEDPFANPLIPKRLMAGANGVAEEELVLWLVDGQFDQKRLFQQYGYLFSNRKISSEIYRRLVESLIKSYTDGPTLQVLEAVVATMAGQPVIREAVETVQGISVLNGKRIIITDASTYQVDETIELRLAVVVGAVLTAGTPLTTVAQVFDYTRSPDWWTTVPALAMGQDYIAADIGPLGFVNRFSKVGLEPTLDLVDGTATPAQFFLMGSPDDITKFWDLARAKTTAGKGLGDLMWTQAGKVDIDGAPDFTKDLYVNPLEFLVQNLIGRHTIVVKMKIDLVNRAESFLDTLGLLQNVIPSWCSLLVIFEVTVDDTYAFQNPSEPALTELNLIATEDLIRGATENFTGATDAAWNDLDVNGDFVTKTPEALSDAYTPATIIETLDLDATVLEEVLHKFTDACTP